MACACDAHGEGAGELPEGCTLERLLSLLARCQAVAEAWTELTAEPSGRALRCGSRACVLARHACVPAPEQVVANRRQFPPLHHTTCRRLLHSVRLQHAEGSARILPLSAELRSFWGNRDGGATIAPLAEQSGEEAAASVRTLASARRCGNMRCVEVAGASDASLPLRMCSVCRVPRYCSEQCQHADWRAGHRRLCRQLAAERAAGAGAAAAEAEGSSGGG